MAGLWGGIPQPRQHALGLHREVVRSQPIRYGAVVGLGEATPRVHAMQERWSAVISGHPDSIGVADLVVDPDKRATRGPCKRWRVFQWRRPLSSSSSGHSTTRRCGRPSRGASTSFASSAQVVAQTSSHGSADRRRPCSVSSPARSGLLPSLSARPIPEKGRVFRPRREIATDGRHSAGLPPARRWQAPGIGSGMRAVCRRPARDDPAGHRAS